MHDFVTEHTTVAGWGFTDPEIRQISEDLLFVQIPIRDKCACDELYTFRKLDEGQLCVGLSTGKDSCNGDSGGPLMKHFDWKGKRRTFVLGKFIFPSIKNDTEGLTSERTCIHKIIYNYGYFV